MAKRPTVLKRPRRRFGVDSLVATSTDSSSARSSLRFRPFDGDTSSLVEYELKAASIRLSSKLRDKALSAVEGNQRN